MKENKGIIKRFWQQSLFRFDELSKAKTSKVQMKATQSANLSLCNNSSRANRVAVALLAFLAMGSLFAQGAPGTIQGRILDSGTGDPMIGVTAFIREANVFGVTDIDGNYVIPDVPPGQHTVVFQMAGYETSQEVINMAAGGFEELNITMSYKTAKEVVVKAKRVSNTAASLLSRQKKAAAAQDAISSEQISKSPDSDAGDAAKRVTGVSLVGGKFIYVRGMPERYTQTLIDGMYVASTVPTRRVIALDTVPTSLLDSLTVLKSYSSEYPGDFGGGTLNIATKDSIEPGAKIAVSSGLHSIAHNSSNGYAYSNQSWQQYLGIDTYRGMPDSWPTKNQINSGYYYAADRKAFGDSLKNEFKPKVGQPIPNGGVSGNYSAKYTLENGYNLFLSFDGSLSESASMVKDYTFKRYFADGSLLTDLTYSTSQLKTVKTGFISSVLQGSDSRYKALAFITQKTSDQVKISDGQSNVSDSGIQEKIFYDEQTLIYTQLSGENFLSSLKSKLGYKLGFNRAITNSPYGRIVKYSPDYRLLLAQPLRLNFLTGSENIIQSQAFLETRLKFFNGLQSKLTNGVDITFRSRDGLNRRFQGNWFDTTPFVNGTYDSSTSVETIISEQGYDINEMTGVDSNASLDKFASSLNIYSYFVNYDFFLMPKFRIIPGLRIENWEQKTKSIDPFDETDFEDSVLSGTDLLPSLNTVYAITNQVNLRTGYSRTINRPEFIESANSRFYDDLILDAPIIGNPDLKSTSISSFDMRIEWFPSASEVLAISAYYKNLENPIESAILATGSSLLYTYYNQTMAEIYGAEFEMRVSIGRLYNQLEHVSFLFNSTVIDSQITFNPEIETSETNSNRPLQGQPTYLVNAGLFFDNNTLEASILGNINGPKVDTVGIAGNPNIIEKSYLTLDFVTAYKINKQSKVKLSVKNIINPVIEKTQTVANIDRVVESYRKGTSIGIKYSYDIF